MVGVYSNIVIDIETQHPREWVIRSVLSNLQNEMRSRLLRIDTSGARFDPFAAVLICIMLACKKKPSRGFIQGKVSYITTKKMRNFLPADPRRGGWSANLRLPEITMQAPD
jgi:hypothetical protein